MTDNRTTDSDIENLVAMVMQADVQASGPVPDDPREAYMRGIMAALTTLGGRIVMSDERIKRFETNCMKNAYECFPCGYLRFCEDGQSVIDNHIREVTQSSITNRSDPFEPFSLYREGYMDGYRDSHTDAVNGHDEQVRATLS